MTDTTQADAPLITEEAYKQATERLWKTYTITNELIRFADTKAALLLTFIGVIMGGSANALKGYKPFFDAHPYHFLFVILAVECFVVAAFYCLGCVVPRLTGPSHRIKPGKNSTIFFDHIAERPNLDVYRKNVLQINGAKGEFQEISEQVYVVSHIARIKNECVGAAIAWAKVGVALATFVAVLLSE